MIVFFGILGFLDGFLKVFSGDFSDISSKKSQHKTLSFFTIRYLNGVSVYHVIYKIGNRKHCSKIHHYTFHSYHTNPFYPYNLILLHII